MKKMKLETLKKDKRAIEIEMIVWWAIAIGVLILIIIIYLVLKGKGISIIDYIKDLFRFKS